MSTDSTARRSLPRRVATLFITAAAFTVAVGNGNAALAAAGPTRIAWHDASGLVQSTGNLYWTSNFDNEFDPPSASVYRASKESAPGSERLLYRETRNAGVQFAEITYAYVGDWYGYFVANYDDVGVSVIKRVPLAGGPAVALAQSPMWIGDRDLVTDGSSLYWADKGGLRKMPIAGGAVTTLAWGSLTKRVGLDSTRVFYSAGTVIRSVPKTGGTVTQHVAASSNVTSMHVHRASTGTVIYWGEENASVKSLSLGGSVTSHQEWVSGRTTTSVYFDGSRVLWTDCTDVGNGCYVRKRHAATTTVVGGSGVGVGAHAVQGDVTAVFWTDAGGVWRFVH